MSGLNQYEWILFFLQIGAMLAAALTGGYIMRRIHQPAVLGELLGGILLGPTLLGTWAPQAYAWLFPPQSSISLAREAVISLGMLFFMFVAGLEINLERLHGRSRVIVLTGSLGVLIPFLFGFGAVWFYPEVWNTSLQVKGFSLPLFIGAAFAISALPMIARILIDLNLLDKEIGILVMTSAAIHDLIGWTLFTAILSATLAQGGLLPSLGSAFALAVCASAVIWIVGRWLASPILRWTQSVFEWPSGFIGVTIVWILAAAAFVERLGMHPVFGAFLIGVALGQGIECRKNHSAHEIIHQFAVSFFAPLYFVSVGLQANFAANFDIGLILLVVLIASLGKIAGAGLGAWLGGFSLRNSLAVGCGLNARGAMEMILASIALECQVIDQRIFVALVVMAIATSIMSGPLLQRTMR